MSRPVLPLLYCHIPPLFPHTSLLIHPPHPSPSFSSSSFFLVPPYPVPPLLPYFGSIPSYILPYTSSSPSSSSSISLFRNLHPSPSLFRPNLFSLCHLILLILPPYSCFSAVLSLSLLLFLLFYIYFFTHSSFFFCLVSFILLLPCSVLFCSAFTSLFCSSCFHGFISFPLLILFLLYTFLQYS